MQVIGAVAHLAVGFRCPLHIGADAPEPEQIDLRLEDCPNEGRRAQAVRLDAKQRLCLRRKRDLLLRPGKDAAAPGNQRCVIIGRSEEHTSELQSLMRISYAVFCLKKKKNKN